MSSTSKLPEWAELLIRICHTVAPFLVMMAGLLFVLLLVLIVFKRTEFSWLVNVVGAIRFFGFLGVLLMMVAAYDTPLTGWIGAVLGLGFYLSPLLFVLLASHLGLSAHSAHIDLIEQVSSLCQHLGTFLVALAIVDLMQFYVRRFMSSEAERRTVQFKYIDLAAVKNVEKPSLVPKCWQMSRCRASVRMSCPNYIGRKTCWQQRSGCFCDRSLANYLMESVGKGEAQEVIDMQRDVGKPQVATTSGKPAKKASRPSWRDQKSRCYNCPLFNEHQEYKYRHFHWSSFLVTAAIVAAVYPLYHDGYEWLVGQLDVLLQQHVLKSLPVISGDTSLANSPFEYVLLGVLALLLLSYVIGIVDRIFLEWKL
jgi:hypothetical protein